MFFIRSTLGTRASKKIYFFWGSGTQGISEATKKEGHARSSSA